MEVNQHCKIVLAFILIHYNFVIDSYLEKFVDDFNIICVSLTRSVSKVKYAELVFVKALQELVDIAERNVVVKCLVNQLI